MGVFAKRLTRLFVPIFFRSSKRISTSILNANSTKKLVRPFQMLVFSSFFFLKKRIKIQGFMPSCKKWKPTQSSDFKRFANSQNRSRTRFRFCMGLFFKQSCMMPSLETVFLVHFYAYRFNSDFKFTSFWTWFRIFLNLNIVFTWPYQMMREK